MPLFHLRYDAGRLSAFLVMVVLAFCGSVAVSTANGEEQLPARVARQHWSFTEIELLAEKYGVSRKLPESTLVEKKELALILSAILEKVAVTCEREGADALPQEDRERLVRLYNALKEDLAQYEGYLKRREVIESVLIRPEVPEFEYKVGLGGFLRGEGGSNFTIRDLSYKPQALEGSFLYRVKPYLYWHPTDYLDIHVEGQGYGFTGGESDFHRYSLYQGYLETHLPQSDRLALKLGRQEFQYGSSFILGTDSFHDGLTYDALRLKIKPRQDLTIDLFGGYYAKPFSNGVSEDLAGIHLTGTFSEGNALEAYFISDGGAAVRRPGERLQIYGLRGTAVLGPVNLEFEPVYESGDVFSDALGRNTGVNAFGGHADAAVSTTIGKFNNKFVLGYAYGSGDTASTQGISTGREFRNPNNDTSLVGDLGLIGDLSGLSVGSSRASGLQIYTLGWGIDLTRELNFSTTAHYYVANRVPDGFSRQIGVETDFSLTYAFDSDFSAILAYDRFLTGRFFRDAAGDARDVNYAYLMLQFNLSSSKPKAKTR